ncbi:D-3-phosphoglycerate dehydrogenase [hydrothermal vent metagenome]|uniref:D-3-phosphoglycerate dehydrogenase n=1 Tax=hydrothermal vent metagenome TaxID=652676 RepID=A0A3B0TT87_9ZZZZ
MLAGLPDMDLGRGWILKKVLITQKLLASCEESLEKRFDVFRLYEQQDREQFLKKTGPEIKAIAGWRVDAGLMDKLPNLKMIANFGVGYDGIDIKEAKKRAIMVTNTPDVLNDAMAEMAVGLMIALCRRLPAADAYVRTGKWAKKGSFPLQTELTGKTLGIVGLGRIGKEIALRCQAMKMRVVYFGRNKQTSQPYVYYDDLVEMAKKSDWLVVATPGGSETEKLVDQKVLAALGPNGNLVNMARGTVVDQAALVLMLQSGGIGGAALDVFEDEPNVPDELIKLENVVLSPHQGSATDQTRFAMGQLVVDNLAAFFAKEPLLTRVV